MARIDTKKEKSEKKQPKNVKRDEGRGRKKDISKGGALREQITSLGGDAQDMDLLKDVDGDAQLEVGEQGHDSALASDVSKFLQDLKSGKPGKLLKAAKNEKHSEKENKGMGKKEQRKEEGQKSRTKRGAQKDSEAHETKPIPPPSIPKGHKLIHPPDPQWYTSAPPLSPPAKPLPTPSPAQLFSLSEQAANLLRRDTELYQSSATSTGHSASDTHFLNTILTQGTLSDRLSALTLLVQGSPVHNIKSLEMLKSMAERGRGKGGREEGLKAMRCIVDWWVGGGAPGRKLKYLRDQPFLLHPDVKNHHLILWYFEDWLKKFFFSVLQILETYSLDPLPYVRTQTLAFIATLLRDKPEQEQNLLRLLVNKMGDTEKGVCSRASYHILQILQAHPAMKSVIVQEIRSLIFRPTASTSTSIQEAAANKAKTHIRFADDDEGKTKAGSPAKKSAKEKAPMDRWNTHSWYYSSVTLNQIVLTPSEQDKQTARLLIEAYFEMFREILGSAPNDGEGLDEIGAGEGEGVKEAGDTKRTDKKQRGKKGKEKEKAVQGAAGFTEIEDTNSRLVSAILTGVNRALPFAKVDVGDGNEMFKKHIDTLFLITHTSTFNISLQALMLILQVITVFAANSPSSPKAPEGSAFSVALTDRFYRTLYASLLDPRLSKSNKQAMYLNLFFKAVKVDKNLNRVKAFVRRFTQILVAGVGGSGGPEFVAGGLYLLGELFSTITGVRELFTVSPKPISGEGESYDPRKRDPQYARASASPMYELVLLTHHYHPAVSLHTRQLLSSAPLTATPDLSLNTLSHFLDRFVYKNPKKQKKKGASVMQPAASTSDGGASGVKLLKGEVTSQGGPVNEASWWKRRVENVPVDEIFFHKYFQRRHEEGERKKAKVGKRRGKEDSDGERMSDEDEEGEEGEEGGNSGEENSDKEEAEIWKAMKASMPSALQNDLPDDSSDDVPSDLDMGDGSDLEVPSDRDEEDGDDAEEGEEDVSSGKVNDSDGDGDDVLSLAEGSDAEDLIPLDADIPDGLIEYDGSDVSDAEGAKAEDEEWAGFGGSSKKRKRDGKGEERGKGRKRLRSLPTFASYEDYAKLIEDGPEDNI